MKITEFIARYANHPILFVGSGLSLRYLESSFNWNGLLEHIAFKVFGTNENYLDIKHKHTYRGIVDYKNIATDLEKEFNEIVSRDRDGELSFINDQFYQNMANDISISRFKLFIASLFTDVNISTHMKEEISILKKARKNIGSVITTNYDGLIEKVFEFSPLIGNDILLSNPYGSVYKIHGCYTQPHRIVINADDYDDFDKRYELIRAQLLSLFIHNPIIFIGYSVSDDNIRNILKTVFSYVEIDSPEAEKIKNNFLLIEYQKDENNLIVSDYDIVLDDGHTIRINKIRTDNYIAIYESISELQLPITALDIRKVQNVVKQIYEGSHDEEGSITVNITEDLDSLKNSDKILAIGSTKTIQYQFNTATELCTNYFKIIEESNKQLLRLIDRIQITSSQLFPILGFLKVCPDLKKGEALKGQQINKIEDIRNRLERCKIIHHSVQEVLDSDRVIQSQKINCIIWNFIESNINMDDMKDYLFNYTHKTTTEYRKLLVVYDYKVNI